MTTALRPLSPGQGISIGSDGAAAAFGSLDPRVAEYVNTLRDFSLEWERLLGQLFGGLFRRNATREELLRQIVLAFARGGTLPVSVYVKNCIHYATPPSIRAELEVIVLAGLVMLERGRGRSPLVVPTCKLIDFYNQRLGLLAKEGHLVSGDGGVPPAEHRYQLYFLAGNRILARQEFAAEDAEAALWIAGQLREICSDVSEAVELWEGDRRIASARSFPTNPAAIRDATEHRLIETEESILRSQCTIAFSRQLLARMNAGRR